MKILIIGSGGREHALAWKAAQSSKVQQVFVAPGNAGTQLEDKISNIDIAADDIQSLIHFAKQNNIDLTIVGPEQPLVLGIVDQFQAESLPIFGPSQKAAQLEGSKIFSKEFLIRHKIPTAFFSHFTEVNAAKKYIEEQGTPIVIKADGLAAGKGVVIAYHQEEAFAAVEDMLEGNRFGEAGHSIVIEEFLEGEEASFIVMADGQHILPLATSQDHKARDNGDKGPNTGGMGAYSPAPIVTEALHEKIMQDIIIPTISGLQKEGMPYTGFLYAGLMINTQNQDIKVLEYNCRFGDPETQPILSRLHSDLVELCLLATQGQLNQATAEWDPRYALGVVMAAGGYPNQYEKGHVISGLEHSLSNTKVFHAGTQQKDSHTITTGGRVLCVVALDYTLSEAQKLAYERVRSIQWNDVYYRNDIGFKAINKK